MIKKTIPKLRILIFRQNETIKFCFIDLNFNLNYARFNFLNIQLSTFKMPINDGLPTYDDILKGTVPEASAPPSYEDATNQPVTISL